MSIYVLYEHICFVFIYSYFLHPRWFSSKESTCNAGDKSSISGLGRSPGEGSGNPLQYPCLVNLMDRGAWWATVRGAAESGMTEQLTLTYLLFPTKNCVFAHILFLYLRTLFTLGKLILSLAPGKFESVNSSMTLLGDLFWNVLTCNCSR